MDIARGRHLDVPRHRICCHRLEHRGPLFRADRGIVPGTGFRASPSPGAPQQIVQLLKADGLRERRWDLPRPDLFAPGPRAFEGYNLDRNALHRFFNTADIAENFEPWHVLVRPATRGLWVIVMVAIP